MNNLTSQSKFDNCVSDILSRSIFTAWFSVYLLFLPVFLYVLYIAFNKWKKPQSSASGLSHSDVFTLNMVAMEMASIVGSCITMYGYYTFNPYMSSAGGNTVIVTRIGQVLFHSLTCVERYLAVVRPVTYLRLRGEGGVTIRNISIALVWLFGVIYSLVSRFVNYYLFHAVAGVLLSIGPLPLVAYCSIYVLCVLIRPKPGAVGGHRKQIDQSKRTTVYTMVAILGALLLRLITDVMCNSTHFSSQSRVHRCVIMMSSMWSILPSSLVLPLLFLQKSGKLTLCK